MVANGKRQAIALLGATVGVEPKCRATPIRILWAVAGLFAAVLAMPATALADPVEHLVAVVATKGSVHQPYGEEVLVGVTAAADRINADGGVLGAPVRLVVWNEDCTRERAAQIAEEITRLKPSVVIGHLCAGAALAAAPIYGKGGVLLIVPGVRHPALTKSGAIGGLLLRLAGRDDRFAVDAVRFIKQWHAGKSVAVIGDRTRQGRGLADSMTAELRRQHVALALDVRIESGEKSYDPLAARLRESGAGVVVMPAQPIELGVVARSLRRAGVEVPIIGSEIVAVPALVTTAERQGDRLVVMMPWTGLESGESEGPEAGNGDNAREAVRRRAEASLEVWAAAAKRAGSTDTRSVAAAARAYITPTTVGPLQFDEAGDAMVPGYVASTWRKGEWRPRLDWRSPN
ncbi:MAG: branched-chain amino acid ABC transporter substrate-binding protein [Hyphomicrobiaceae bacterium]